jgi:hypothetical protein
MPSALPLLDLTTFVAESFSCNEAVADAAVFPQSWLGLGRLSRVQPTAEIAVLEP